MNRSLVPVLTVAGLLACGGAAVATDWYAVDPGRVRIAAQHPAFPGRHAEATVREPDDIARNAQADWLRLGRLTEPGPAFAATYQTQQRPFPSYTLMDSLNRKAAFRAFTVDVLGEGPRVRSDFGPVESVKVRIRKDGTERQCGYWHWQREDNRAYFDGWYCPATGQEVSDDDIRRSVWSVRWGTQVAQRP